MIILVLLHVFSFKFAVSKNFLMLLSEDLLILVESFRIIKSVDLELS